MTFDVWLEYRSANSSATKEIIHQAVFDAFHASNSGPYLERLQLALPDSFGTSETVLTMDLNPNESSTGVINEDIDDDGDLLINKVWIISIASVAVSMIFILTFFYCLHRRKVGCEMCAKSDGSEADFSSLLESKSLHLPPPKISTVNFEER